MNLLLYEPTCPPSPGQGLCPCTAQCQVRMFQASGQRFGQRPWIFYFGGFARHGRSLFMATATRGRKLEKAKGSHFSSLECELPVLLVTMKHVVFLKASCTAYHHIFLNTVCGCNCAANPRADNPDRLSGLRRQRVPPQVMPPPFPRTLVPSCWDALAKW